MSTTALVVLDLDDLGGGLPGIGPKFGAALAEAAVVCLQSQAHTCGVAMAVSGDLSRRCAIQWTALPDKEQANRTWGDPEIATEHGAYGIAALLIAALTDWTIVERARKGTGFDYWLGPKEAPGPLFQGKARLEVSGIRYGSLTEIQTRGKQKLKQVRKSASLNMTGIIVIVEFGAPVSHVVNT